MMLYAGDIFLIRKSIYIQYVNTDVLWNILNQENTTVFIWNLNLYLKYFPLLLQQLLATLVSQTDPVTQSDWLCYSVRLNQLGACLTTTREKLVIRLYTDLKLQITWMYERLKLFSVIDLEWPQPCHNEKHTWKVKLYIFSVEEFF